MKCISIRYSPWKEILFYASGMVSLAFGIGMLIAIADSSSFSPMAWYCLLVTGMLFIATGVTLLVASVKVPFVVVRETSLYLGGTLGSAMSEQDLLDEVESINNSAANSPAICSRDTLNASRTVKSCMMLQSAENEYFLSQHLFYKETFV